MTSSCSRCGTHDLYIAKLQALLTGWVADLSDSQDAVSTSHSGDGNVRNQVVKSDRKEVIHVGDESQPAKRASRRQSLTLESSLSSCETFGGGQNRSYHANHALEMEMGHWKSNVAGGSELGESDGICDIASIKTEPSLQRDPGNLNYSNDRFAALDQTAAAEDSSSSLFPNVENLVSVIPSKEFPGQPSVGDKRSLRNRRNVRRDVVEPGSSGDRPGANDYLLRPFKGDPVIYLDAKNSIVPDSPEIIATVSEGYDDFLNECSGPAVVSASNCDVFKDPNVPIMIPGSSFSSPYRNSCHVKQPGDTPFNFLVTPEQQSLTNSDDIIDSSPSLTRHSMSNVMLDNPQHGLLSSPFGGGSGDDGDGNNCDFVADIHEYHTNLHNHDRGFQRATTATESLSRIANPPLSSGKHFVSPPHDRHRRQLASPPNGHCPADPTKMLSIRDNHMTNMAPSTSSGCSSTAVTNCLDNLREREHQAPLFAARTSPPTVVKLELATMDDDDVIFCSAAAGDSSTVSPMDVDHQSSAGGDGCSRTVAKVSHQGRKIPATNASSRRYSGDNFALSPTSPPVTMATTSSSASCSSLLLSGDNSCFLSPDDYHHQSHSSAQEFIESNQLLDHQPQLAVGSLSSPITPPTAAPAAVIPESEYTITKRGKYFQYNIDYQKYLFTNQAGLAECKFCGYAPTQKQILYQHIRQKHLMMEFTVCHICSKEFRLRSLYKNHFIKEHSGLTHDFEATTCSECGRWYSTVWSLRRHMNTAHGRKQRRGIGKKR